MDDPLQEKLAIQICSDSEWESTKSLLNMERHRLSQQPFGEWFSYPMRRQERIFFQSGASKTRAAAACQFALSRWHPQAVINLGTCGGVSEEIRKGDIILADRTIRHDCIIRFGESSNFPYEPMISVLDTSWVDMGQVSREFFRGTIATGDQDLDGVTRKRLQEESRLEGWNILGADWKSGAIAKVAVDHSEIADPNPIVICLLQFLGTEGPWIVFQ